MNGLRVLKTSILASLQDRGRFGYGDIGISQSGIMDEFSFNHLNNLLANPFNTNALEIYLGGVEFEVLGNTYGAYTGADANISINASKVPMWQSLALKNGDKIKIDFAKKGSIIYFGVAGGFGGDKILGSHSLSQKEGIGKVLRVGDVLEFTCKNTNEIRKLKKEFLPKFEDEISLRLIPSYQFEDFDKEDIYKFFNTTYKVSPQSNRMGVRLNGEALKNVKKGIISEGISYASVQIPSHGEPIVLLKERQTIGGYPKIGSILPLDAFKLAQSRVGNRVRFEKISLEYAGEKMREFYRDFSFYM